MTDWREKYCDEMKLPKSARFTHKPETVAEMEKKVRSNQPTHNPEMVTGRAKAILDAQQHQRSQAKSFIVTKDHNWRRKLEVAIFILMFLFCLVMAVKTHAQTTTIQGRAKGATAGNTATVTANDANHNGLDVNVLNGGSGGTASSFGAAFPATGTAAGFSDGVNMLPALLDASGFLKINCAAGCVAGGSFIDASAFTFGTTSVGNMSAVVDDVATNTVAENSAGVVRMSGQRILYVDLSKSTTTSTLLGHVISDPLSVTSIYDGGRTATVTAANALKVDGSAVTQPVSGTVATSNFPATVDTNSGVKSANTVRFVLATDQPQLTNKLLVTPDSVALPANQSVNVNQINSVTPLMGNGVTGTGSPRVTVASDNTPFPVKLDPTTLGTTNGVTNYQLARTTGTLTSVTCPGTGCVSVATTGYGVATVTISGTYSLTALPEFSDDGGTTWYGTTCTQTDSSSQVITFGALVTTNRAWDCSVYAASNFRIRASAFTSGTANIGITLSSAPIEAAPTVALATGSTVAVTQATAANLNVTDVGTLADNGVPAATNRVGTVPGIYETSYQNGTAGTAGRNAALSIGTDGLLWTANLPAIRPASYVASAAFAGSSTTDNAVMPGNASNTVLVTMVKVSCTQTTAGAITLTLLKRSTADTVGTSAAMTAVPDDSNYAAAASAPLSYTGTGPTVGTPVGNVDNVKLGCEATTTAAPQDIYILNRRQKPIVLRGTAQQLAVNAGGAITGGNITVTFEWIETATILP